MTSAEKGRRFRERHHAAGRCVSCGKAPARAGKRTCEACCRRNAANKRKLQGERLDAGLCMRCGRRAPSPGTHSCVVCIDAELERKGAKQ